MPSAPIQLMPHVRALKERYTAWLCDVWGVVHNGVAPYAGAVDALIQFRKAGGAVVLLTNAPRPEAPIRRQLARIGVPAEAFDAVVTSGDAARDWLGQLKGRPVHHLGPKRDGTLFCGLDLNFAGIGRAEVVVCTGLTDDRTETAADYAPVLAELAGRGVTMMCANPDLVIDRGGILVPCAGALAEAYRQAGGTVVFTGKPHRPIYELAMARLGQLMDREPARAEILAIGDGLDTDIAGAAGAGIDSLFIAGGIHVGEVADGDGKVDGERLAELFAGSRRPPVAAQCALTW